MTIVLKQFRRLGLWHVTSSDWIEHIIRVIIPYICMYRTHVFWSTNILPHHRSTSYQYFSPIGSWYIIGQCHIIGQRHISSQIQHYRTVYVNNIMNSTVHVNNVVYLFMLLLKFLTVLNSKLLFDLLSDLSFIVKWPWCP